MQPEAARQVTRVRICVMDGSVFRDWVDDVRGGGLSVLEKFIFAEGEGKLEVVSRHFMKFSYFIRVI